MFEITTRDKKKFETVRSSHNVNALAVYDFTFENRYYIYHENRCGMIEYIALDKESGLGSSVVRRKSPLLRTQFRSIIVNILYSTKYTGDTRYTGAFQLTPPNFIETVFRQIMPEYGYTVREEQIHLAKDMYDGLCRRSAALCEAEVGSGKTMAYLVAGIAAKLFDERYRYTGNPITISTSGIELQKMIIEKEIPALSEMLYQYGLILRPLKAILRKGKEHYFCQRRFEDYLDSITAHPGKYSETIALFDRLDLERSAFDLDRISVLKSHTKARICVKGSCSRCPCKTECRYAQYMETACKPFAFDFQVTNHNLYLTAQMMKHDPKNPTDGILLDSNFVILDEAHKIPETACQVFGKELPATAVPKYLNAMQHACNRKKISSAAYAAFLEQAAKENAALFALLRTSEDQTADDDSGQSQVVLTDSMKKHMKKLIGLIREIENYSVEQPHYKGVRSEGIVKALETFPVSSSILLWLSTDPETEAVSLCCAPKNLEPMMRGTLWNEPDTHRVLTSGTMRDDTGFSYFREELGLGAVESAMISEHTCDSPFDYQNHTRLYISENVGFPDNSSDTYLDEASREVTALVKATNGHTAVLFTSYKVLSAVFDRVKDELSAFPLIRMTRSNRGAIDEFRKSGNGVLFASGSMWEGVDCIGDILSSVIIVKLPFPLRTELLEQKKKKCATVQDFIQAYAVPQMLIKLRQGAGRLIRCESDTGVLSILDARAAKGGNYRNRVLASLAKYPIAESVEEIADFISAVKPKAYFQTEES